MAQISQRRKRQMQREAVNNEVEQKLKLFKQKRKAADQKFKRAVHKMYGVFLNADEVKGIKRAIKRNVMANEHFTYDHENNFLQILNIRETKMRVFGQFLFPYAHSRHIEAFLYTVLDDKEYAFKLLQMKTD